jgi:hypothetical protein
MSYCVVLWVIAREAGGGGGGGAIVEGGGGGLAILAVEWLANLICLI